MRKSLLACAAVGSIILSFGSLPGENAQRNRIPQKGGLTKVVIGYFPSWNKEEFGYTKIDYKNLTHIANAFTRPDSKGNLIVPKDYLYPELNAEAHKNNVKVIMSVGGWGNCAGFPGMASTAAKRRRFIAQALNFCKKNSYDGVDLDWEFVSNDDERRNFVSLVKELSAALKAQSPPLLLTMAAPADAYWAQWIKYEDLVASFDYIGIMTYDFHGSWSDHSGHNAPLYSPANDSCGSVNDSYIYAHSVRKIPNKKLLLGIPFYGRSFDCAGLYQDFQNSGDDSFAAIRKLIPAGWDFLWDGVAKVPWLRKKDKSKIICYDDARSVALKCRYVKNKKAAGIMIWDISQDYYKGSSVLLASVGKEFGN